ncbi:hypothetical protein L9F63_013966, partial [Diploptera punctata]
KIYAPFILTHIYVVLYYIIIIAILGEYFAWSTRNVLSVSTSLSSVAARLLCQSYLIIITSTILNSINTIIFTRTPCPARNLVYKNVISNLRNFYVVFVAIGAVLNSADMEIRNLSARGVLKEGMERSRLP